MTEIDYEKQFNIITSGEQKNFYDSLHYNRYEPTSYLSLDTLFEEYIFSPNDSVIDFGCGKGRLNFYINYFFQANTTGIEMNNYYYKQCLQNLKSYYLKNKKKPKNINFENCLAQDYRIKDIDNKFYFFNPFSAEIFMKIIENILYSKEKQNRTVDIILFYPSDDYIYYLENYTAFYLFKEVKVFPQYEKDSKYKFIIYRIN